MRVRNIRRAAALALFAVLALTGCTQTPYLNLAVDGEASFENPEDSTWGAYGTVESVDTTEGTLTVDVTHQTELDRYEPGGSETHEVSQEVTFQVAEAIRRCGLWSPAQGFAVPLEEFEQGATVTLFGTDADPTNVNVGNLRYCVAGDD